MSEWFNANSNNTTVTLRFVSLGQQLFKNLVYEKNSICDQTNNWKAVGFFRRPELIKMFLLLIYMNYLELYTIIKTCLKHVENVS